MRNKLENISRTDVPAPDAVRLIAYRLHCADAAIVPAQRSRLWMDETEDGFANRCLPLRIANLAGWFVLNDRTLDVSWNGTPALDSVHVRYLDDQGPGLAVSHFGSGILTWHVPYLFRTSPAYNLLVRGPSNWPKDGISPLEGIVETDWAVATFTMNWKLTRPNHVVRFESGEPICMIVPHHRGDLERVITQTRELDSDSDLQFHYETWRSSREQFNAQLEVPGSHARHGGWQKDYFRGSSPSGASASEHQIELKLRPFNEESD